MEHFFALATPLEIRMMLRGFIPIVMILIIGIFIGRWDNSKHQQTLNKLTDYIFLPCLAFSAIHKHAFDPVEIFSIGAAVLMIMVGMTVVSFFTLRDKVRGCSGNLLASVYMSSGSLLPPLAFVLFGYEGLAKAIYFHLFVTIFYYTAGRWMVSGRADFKSFFKTPLFHLIILGIAARNFPFSLSDNIQELSWLLEKGIHLTAMGSLPLLIISFGYPLGLLKRSDANGGFVGGALRIVAGPLVALLVVCLYRMTGLTSMERGYDVLGYLDYSTTEALLLLGAAMPSSHRVICLAGDAGKAERGTILVSVTGAVITIPIVLLYILMYIFEE